MGILKVTIHEVLRRVSDVLSTMEVVAVTIIAIVVAIIFEGLPRVDSSEATGGRVSETRTREGMAEQQACQPSSSMVILRSRPEAQSRGGLHVPVPWAHGTEAPTESEPQVQPLLWPSGGLSVCSKDDRITHKCPHWSWGPEGESAGGFVQTGQTQVSPKGSLEVWENLAGVRTCLLHTQS